MKKSRYTNEQIVHALRQTEGGTPVVEVCRAMGVSEPTFYRWKKRFGDLGLSEVRELRQCRIDLFARQRRMTRRRAPLLGA